MLEGWFVKKMQHAALLKDNIWVGKNNVGYQKRTAWKGKRLRKK